MSANDFIPSGTRICTLCKKVKPFTEFYRDKSRALGFIFRCKPCERNRTADRKPSKQTREKGAMRARSRVRDANRKRAGDLLRAAVKSGKVVKWPACAVPECNRTNLHGHHVDYDQPLSVVWLCASHHRLVHTLIKE